MYQSVCLIVATRDIQPPAQYFLSWSILNPPNIGIPLYSRIPILVWWWWSYYCYCYYYFSFKLSFPKWLRVVCIIFKTYNSNIKHQNETIKYYLKPE